MIARSEVLSPNTGRLLNVLCMGPIHFSMFVA